MTEHTVKPRLHDIVEAIERIHRQTDGITLEAFEADWLRRWAEERGIEIISEASRHLPAEMKARHPDIPWRKVAGIGNVLRHEYERTAPEVLWGVAYEDLPPLEKVCRDELARDSGQQS